MPPLLIVLLGVVAYWNSLQGVFFFDDGESIERNASIQRPWDFAVALNPPDNTPVAARPLVNLTFALNYWIGGTDPFGYHLVNLAIHLGCALLLFALVRRTLQRPRFGPATRSAAAALATAATLLWVVHPLLTDAVTYVTQRTELLVCFFLLATLYGASRYRDGVGGRGWGFAAVTAAVLGAASKEVMVAAPLLVLAYDYLFLPTPFRERFAERWRLYLGLLLCWVVIAALQLHSPRSDSVGLDFRILTPWNYLKTQAALLVHYVRLVLWPHPLNVDYDGWPVTPRLVDVLPQALAVLALLGATAWGLVRRHPASFLGAAFFLILAPTSSFLPIASEVGAERRMYLPSAAVIILVVSGAWTGLRWLVSARRLPAVPVAVASGAAVAVLVVALVARTQLRNTVYADDLSIWQNAVEVDPGNARAWNNLGVGLGDRGEHAAAIVAYRQAIELKPRYAAAYDNLGSSLGILGRPQEAAEAFRKAIELRPGMINAHYNLGAALEAMGRAAEALPHYAKALELDPNFVEAHEGVGLVLAAQGRFEQARRHFEQVVRLRPEDPNAYRNLALLDSAEGNAARAADYYRKAVSLAPQRVDLLQPLAWLLATHPDAAVAQPAEAVHLAQRAAELTHRGDPLVLDTLAAAYARGGDFGRAAAVATETLAAAEAGKAERMATAVRRRLALYQSGKPYLQPVRPAPSPK